MGQGDGTDWLPATMRAILSKSLTLRGFIYHECAAAHYPAFLHEVGAGITEGRIRYREDIVDGLEKAPEAFLGLPEGRNFGKVIVRVDASRQDGAARRLHTCDGRPVEGWWGVSSARCTTGDHNRRITMAHTAWHS